MSRDRTIDVGHVHVGTAVSIEEWVCADDCPHPDHAWEVNDPTHHRGRVVGSDPIPWPREGGPDEA